MQEKHWTEYHAIARRIADEHPDNSAPIAILAALGASTGVAHRITSEPILFGQVVNYYREQADRREEERQPSLVSRVASLDAKLDRWIRNFWGETQQIIEPAIARQDVRYAELADRAREIEEKLDCFAGRMDARGGRISFLEDSVGRLLDAVPSAREAG